MDTGESAKETVKTIARGMPDRFGLPVATTLVCFFHLHARPRVLAEAPGIPCALFFLRDVCQQTSGASRRENAELYPTFTVTERVDLRRHRM